MSVVGCGLGLRTVECRLSCGSSIVGLGIELRIVDCGLDCGLQCGLRNGQSPTINRNHIFHPQSPTNPQSSIRNSILSPQSPISIDNRHSAVDDIFSTFPSRTSRCATFTSFSVTDAVVLGVQPRSSCLARAPATMTNSKALVRFLSITASFLDVQVRPKPATLAVPRVASGFSRTQSGFPETIPPRARRSAASREAAPARRARSTAAGRRTLPARR
jgi:hypothetical protein